MHLTDIEAKLFAVADSLRERDEGAARKVLAAIAEIRAWHAAEREDWYKRHGDIMQKWNAFSNGMIEDEYKRQGELVEQERARILRAIAVDPRWGGSYGELVKLMKGGDS